MKERRKNDGRCFETDTSNDAGDHSRYRSAWTGRSGEGRPSGRPTTLAVQGQSVPRTQSRAFTTAFRGVYQIRFEVRLGGSTNDLKRMKGIYEAAGLGTDQLVRFDNDVRSAIEKAGIKIFDSDTVRLANLPRVVLDMDIVDQDKMGNYRYTVRLYMDEPVRLQRHVPAVIRDAITWEALIQTDVVRESRLPEMKKYASATLVRFLRSSAEENSPAKDNVPRQKPGMPR